MPDLIPSTTRSMLKDSRAGQAKSPDAARLAHDTAMIDKFDASSSVIDLLADKLFGDAAGAIGVPPRSLWVWLHRGDRMAQYRQIRDLRAHTMVDEAHRRTTALADGAPDDAHAVQTRVKMIQWDASRTSRDYADKSISEVSSRVDVTLHLGDDELASRLASLAGSVPGAVADIVDGEVIDSAGG